MTAIDKLTVSLSAERLVHEVLATLAERMLNEHGIQIMNVNLTWAAGPSGKAQVLALRMETAALMPIKKDELAMVN